MPIFNATLDGTPDEVIACRVFNPALGKWWTGAAWDVEASAAVTVIPSVGSHRHAGPVDYPEPGVLVEYLVDGIYNTYDEIPLPPPTVSLSAEELDQLAVAIAAGVGDNLPSPMVIPLVTGVPTTVSLTKERRINLKQGNTYRLVFSLGRDCAGWEAWFAGKADVKQEEYTLPLRRAVFTNEAGGSGYVDLTQEDTASIGEVHAELQLRRGTERNTPEQYLFKVSRAIVK